MGIPRRRIVRHDVGEQGDRVPVYAGLLPRQNPENGECDRRDSSGTTPDGQWRRADAAHQAPYNDGEQPDSGKVLVPVRNQRKLHIAEVDEPEHWGECHREEQRTSQRPPSDPVAEGPQSARQQRGGDHQQPGPEVPGIDFP